MGSSLAAKVQPGSMTAKPSWALIEALQFRLVNPTNESSYTIKELTEASGSITAASAKATQTSGTTVPIKSYAWVVPNKEGGGAPESLRYKQVTLNTHKLPMKTRHPRL